MWLNHERSFIENRRNCSPSELRASSTDAAYSKHSIAIHSISMAGCVNAVRAIIVCFELPAREASSYCDFWKLTSCNFITFISSFIGVKFNFFFMSLLRINLPNLCPNMNHFDAVDFSECDSEEVISFFWRSFLISLSSLLLLCFSVWYFYSLFRTLFHSYDQLY